MKVLIWQRFLAFFILLQLAACSVVPESRFYYQDFQSLKSDRQELRKFIELFPKGGDLHNHLSGAVYAESYLAWAADDNKCIHQENHIISLPPCSRAAGIVPVRSILDDKQRFADAVDALSVRNYRQGPLSGHDQFFSTFEKFNAATVGRDGDMLAEVIQRAAGQNVRYLEIMIVPGMTDVFALAPQVEENYTTESLQELVNGRPLTRIRDKVIALVNVMEKRKSALLNCGSASPDVGCRVTVRYLPSIVRTLPRKNVLVQTALVASLVAEDPRFVGINILAPEDHPVALNDYDWHMALIRDVSAQYPPGSIPVSLHAGELTPQLVPAHELKDHIHKAIAVAGAQRIGHGISITYESDYKNLLRKMASERILVEINLTSNDVILGVTGDQHPFQMYLNAGVPLALSTDDEGVSRIDLSTEYQRAVESYDLDYKQLKILSRNSLEYSFLPGESLFENVNNNIRKEVCQDYSASCKKFLGTQLKAKLQWELEGRLLVFEELADVVGEGLQ